MACCLPQPPDLRSSEGSSTKMVASRVSARSSCARPRSAVWPYHGSSLPLSTQVSRPAANERRQRGITARTQLQHTKKASRRLRAGLQFWQGALAVSGGGTATLAEEASALDTSRSCPYCHILTPFLSPPPPSCNLKTCSVIRWRSGAACAARPSSLPGRCRHRFQSSGITWIT